MLIEFVEVFRYCNTPDHCGPDCYLLQCLNPTYYSKLCQYHSVNIVQNTPHFIEGLTVDCTNMKEILLMMSSLGTARVASEEKVESLCSSQVCLPPDYNKMNKPEWVVLRPSQYNDLTQGVLETDR